MTVFIYLKEREINLPDRFLPK